MFKSRKAGANADAAASGQPRAAKAPMSLQRRLRLIGLGLLVLAAALVLDGLGQWRVEHARSSLLEERNVVVVATARAAQDATTAMAKAVAAPQIAQAVASKDLPAAAAELKKAWPDAEAADVWPADLQTQYAALPDAAGQLAAAEAALASNAAQLRVVRHGEDARVVLAAPMATGDVRHVAVVRLPLATLTAPVSEAHARSGYLALRQGDYSIVEQGDRALADQAEAQAQRVGDTNMRIATAMPPDGFSLFGLGMLPSLLLAALLAAGGVAAMILPGWLQARGHGVRRGRTAEPDDAAPTFSDTLRVDPLPVAPVAKKAAAEAKPALALDASIFRAYDIRGVMGKTLDRGVAEQIGQAIGSLMHEQDLPDIVVGRDGRLSGPELASGLIAGLRKAGRNVIDIGVVPTPLAYFGSYHLRTGCCVAVTGSHNPPDYNGFKIVVGGETLSGNAITALHQRIGAGSLHAAPAPGLLSERDIGSEYVERISSDVMIERPLKVVVDAGNGAAGELGPRVLEAIGAQVTPLFCEIDGTFPNHHPDPSEPHNLEDLVNMVRRMNADLGIAFDGDGDRLGVVTAEGRIIHPDRVLMLFAEDVLERNPGAMVVYDVKCSGQLPGHILRHGGSPLMWKTGHSLIKAKMRETHAELAGEMSGHFFFAERWYGFDDGIYAAARLLEILASRDGSPGAVLDALPDSVSTPEIKVDVADGDPHALVARFQQQAQFGDNPRRSDIDGLRLDWPDGWGLVRASNTTPVLVMRFDGQTEAALQRIQAAFREQLLAVQPDLVLPF